MVPRFSVIIPAYNEELELPRTLATFAKAIERYRKQGGAGEFEFIIVDNASTDRTAAIAEAWGARVVPESLRQIARVRNTGVGVAKGEIILTCDADSRPHLDLFVTLDRCFDETVMAAGVRIWSSDMKWWYYPAFLFINFASFSSRLPGGMFILRRQDFLEMGGFDETLYALEDVDFSKRLKRLARQRKRRILILWNHPIDTSTRKFRVVRPRTALKAMIRWTLHPRTTLRDRTFWDFLFYGSHLRDKADRA